MLLSRIGLSIVNPRTKGKITELWGLGFTRSSLAAVCGGTHDWRWQGSVREYTRVDLERLDKRPRDRKPGTHREVPKPPSPAVASELKRIQLTEKSSLKDPYNVQNVSMVLIDSRQI